MNPLIHCLAVAATFATHELAPEWKSVCEEVAEKSAEKNIPADLALALTYHESRFRPNVASNRGAFGPMQIKPEYWCPDGTIENCDVIKAGFDALYVYAKEMCPWTPEKSYFSSSDGCLSNVLRAYNAGPSGARRGLGRQYAINILNTLSSFREWVRDAVMINPEELVCLPPSYETPIKVNSLV